MPKVQNILPLLTLPTPYRVETDPRQLWVGPSSEASRDQHEFESSFGPFYRITQLILSTSASPGGQGGEAAPILNQANLLTLFDIHDEVWGGAGWRGGCHGA